MLSELSQSARNQILTESRLRCRERVEKHRLKNKDGSAKEKSNTSAYRTKSALRKATSKTRKSLPLAPGKRNTVLRQIIQSLGPTDQAVILGKMPVAKHGNGKGITDHLIGIVEKFYETDDVSRMSPNVKDCRFSKNRVTGEREIVQIRHLLYPLKEVYSLFLSEYFAQTGTIAEIHCIFL